MRREIPVRITGRSTSHFTRVVTMFAHELGVPFKLDVVNDLRRLDAASYGGHPALKIPTLHVGGSELFGTENICRRLVELAGRGGDPRVLLTEHVSSDLVRSAQELVWQAMATQVQLVVAVGFSNLPRDNVFIAKAEAGMLGSLEWLEERTHAVLGRLSSPRDVSLLEVTLFCLIEHVAFRPTVSLERFSTLRAFARAFAERDAARRTPFAFDPRPQRPMESP